MEKVLRRRPIICFALLYLIELKWSSHKLLSNWNDHRTNSYPIEKIIRQILIKFLSNWKDHQQTNILTNWKGHQTNSYQIKKIIRQILIKLKRPSDKFSDSVFRLEFSPSEHWLVARKDIPVDRWSDIQIHKYTNTNTQIHKYTNTQIPRKYIPVDK